MIKKSFHPCECPCVTVMVYNQVGFSRLYLKIITFRSPGTIKLSNQNLETVSDSNQNLKTIKSLSYYNLTITKIAFPSPRTFPGQILNPKTKESISPNPGFVWDMDLVLQVWLDWSCGLTSAGNFYPAGNFLQIVFFSCGNPPQDFLCRVVTHDPTQLVPSQKLSIYPSCNGLAGA